MFKKKKSADSAEVLKKKALVCSSEAAVISIGIHLLLIFLAGSVVAIRYVQKRDASFEGKNVVRPKLERRQLQMPEKVKNLQKKSSRPKVASRMASASPSSFALPDMTGLDNIGGGFDRTGGERTLSGMGLASSLGFGISGVNFFGAKSNGEKIVFVVNADKSMLYDNVGGYETYQYVKERIDEMISGMRSATLFNLMVYVGGDLRMFSNQLVPANPQNRDAVRKWFEPVNKNDKTAAKLNNLSGKFSKKIKYEDSPLPPGNVHGFLQASQAAMEQGADNIFILCCGWERSTVGKKIEVEDKTEYYESKGWNEQRFAEYNKKVKEYTELAKKHLEAENEARAKAGLGKKFIGSSPLLYAFKEMKLPRFDTPPRLGYFEDFTAEDFIEHLEAVYAYNYVPKNQEKPKIHFVKLVAEDAPTTEGALGSIADAFKGNMKFLQGAKTMKNLVEVNPSSLAPKK